VPEQQEEEAGGDPPLQYMGQRDVPLILEIVKEEDVTMRDEEGWMRDQTNEIRSRQRRKKLMRKNPEKLQKTK